MVTDQGHPVGRRYVCARHRRPVPEEEIVRGYELESGEFVVVTDEELEAAIPEKTRDIDLQCFVLESELEPLLFTRTYVLAPAGPSSKAYRLLVETMEQAGKAGIATFVMRDKAHVVAILAKGGILRAQTLRFSDELRAPESIGLSSPPAVPRPRLKQLLDAVDQLSRDELDLEELSDRYGSKLVELAERKAKRGQDVVEVDADVETESEAPSAAVIDLVALLKERLERADAGRTSSSDQASGPSTDGSARSRSSRRRASRH